jgi:hypothetical protein
MPALPRDDGVELPPGRLPRVKRRHFDRYSALPCELGQPCVGIDPEHTAPGGLQLPRHDARANAHVENEAAAYPIRDALDQGVGIPRAGPVIAVGIGPEGFRRPPLTMRLIPGRRATLV